MDQLHRAPPPAPPAPPKGAGLPSAEASGSRLATVAHNQKEPACATSCRGDGNRSDDWLSALRLEYIRVTHCSLCFARLSTVRGWESLLQYKALLGTLQVLPGLQVGPLSSPCVLSCNICLPRDCEMLWSLSIRTCLFMSCCSQVLGCRKLLVILLVLFAQTGDFG